MKQTRTIWMAVILVLAVMPLMACLATPAYAQVSRLSGTVYDTTGKPYPDVTLVVTSTDNNKVYTAKTDAKGQYIVSGLQGGKYAIDLKVKDQVIYQAGTNISIGSAPVLDFNMKEIEEKNKGANSEAEAKRAEAEKAFQNLKAHFDAGSQAIDAMKAAQAQLAQTPKDQQGPIQDKIKESGQTAVTELGAAQQLMKPDDSNQAIVLGRMGEAYEGMGKYQEAADTYQKTIEMKPDVASNYNNLGNNLAKLGKVDEAKAAYQKYVDLDPADAALAWRNFGIVLYQANRMKEAVEPLQKATTLDPKNAQAWYLLGVALVNTMGFKCSSGAEVVNGSCPDGSKIAVVIQPGTIEAYQHAIDLDPNGTIGAQAKDGLASLQAMGVSGIDTKVGGKAPAPAKGKK